MAKGWKGAEKRYGASNAVIMQWIAACGGQAFLDQRRSLQATGRKAGGRHAPYSPQEGRTDDIGAPKVSDSLNTHNALSGACDADLEGV